MQEQEPATTSTEINDKMRLKAAQFHAQHILTPAEFRASYHRRTIQRWQEEDYPRTHKPMWLRRTFHGPDAYVDYCTVRDQTKIVFGTLVVGQEIELLVPFGTHDQLGIQEYTEPYSFEALAVAINRLERAVVTTD